MTIEEIQYKAQGIIQKWKDDDSAPYVEFVEELATMEIPELQGLDKAAKEYAHCPFTDEHGIFHEDAIDFTAYRDFMAGAKWMAEQEKLTNIL